MDLKRWRKGRQLLDDGDQNGYETMTNLKKAKTAKKVMRQSMIMLFTIIELHFSPIDLIKDNYPKLGAKGLKVLPVWDSITKKLQEAGYSFSNNKYTGTKPKIKWNNLLAKRKEYAMLISATGSSADVLKKKPSYYDEIELIIATSADNNYDDWDKQMEAEMNLDSDNDGRHKRNPIEDSSSDD
ncbi:Uncharacterized protein APZ42_012555 [Daphnia magna]|uniref:Uncharacterized protein n=1 Tax=Daphnia magna TaxID=35525 RepID=A0A162RPX3_9CRUS|nr:Uncharacterized protein APZ42_012555 [Daphnia magna]